MILFTLGFFVGVATLAVVAIATGGRDEQN